MRAAKALVRLCVCTGPDKSNKVLDLHSYLVGLRVLFFTGVFISVHALCMRAAKALVRLCVCPGPDKSNKVLDLHCYLVGLQV